MTYGQHLKRSRHGTLSFRFKFPPDLVAVIGRTELTIGLGTASKRDAMPLAAELKAITIKAVCAARATLMNDPKDAGKLTFKVGDLTFDASTLPVNEGKQSFKIPQSLVPKHQVNTLAQQAEQRAHADNLLRKFAAKLDEDKVSRSSQLRSESQIQAPPLAGR